VVLRPNETATTIPNPHIATDEQKNSHTSLLQFIDHWRYGLLLLIAFVLSLLPMARRRGIILCTVALIAGAFCGHALGRLPVGWQEPYESRGSRTVVCPAKAGMFSRS